MKKHLKGLLIILTLFFIVSCASTSTKTKSGNNIPLWISNDSINDVFPKSEYLTALGIADTAQSAKLAADAELSSYFIQNVSTEIIASEQYSNYENSTDFKKFLEKNIEISSSTEIVGLEHTEAFYDKKRGCYYVCAYINRNDAWKLLEPRLKSAAQAFEQSFSESKKENKAVEKILLQNEALNKASDFYNLYFFACAVKPEKARLYSDIDMQISRLVTANLKLKQQTKIKVLTNGDGAKRIKTKLEELFTKNGFSISNLSANYIVSADAKYLVESSGEVYISYPQIEITIMDNNSIYTSGFSKQMGKVSAYTKEATERMAINKLESELENNFFTECFNDKWSEK